MANFKDRKTTTPLAPPVKTTNIQRLMDIINNRKDSGKPLPYGMPSQPQEAAKWFIGLLEPRMQHEIDELNHSKNGDKKGQQYWSLQYQERLASCLVAYYRLNTNDQRYILGLINKNIAWGGDSIKFMRIREKITAEMLADKNSMQKMLHTMIRRMA